MGAIQPHLQHRGRRQHLPGRVCAQAADGFEPDLEKPVTVRQRYGLAHRLSLLLRGLSASAA